MFNLEISPPTPSPMPSPKKPRKPRTTKNDLENTIANLQARIEMTNNDNERQRKTIDEQRAVIRSAQIQRDSIAERMVVECDKKMLDVRAETQRILQENADSRQRLTQKLRAIRAAITLASELVDG